MIEGDEIRNALMEDEVEDLTYWQCKYKEMCKKYNDLVKGIDDLYQWSKNGGL